MAPKTRFSYGEYAAGEAASAIKHEFLDGDVYAMAGGSITHAALVMALSVAIGGQLRGKPCRAYSSDLRVRIVEGNVATYPDLSVVCGPVLSDPEDPHCALNPTVIVEVLSDGTEAYDRGDKFAAYRRISSLKEYLLVSQHSVSIERFARNADDSWTLTAAGPGSVLTLASLSCDLAVDEIYRDLDLPVRVRT